MRHLVEAVILVGSSLLASAAVTSGGCAGASKVEKYSNPADDTALTKCMVDMRAEYQTGNKTKEESDHAYYVTYLNCVCDAGLRCADGGK